MDVVRPVFIEGDTTFTRIASIPVGSGTKTIYSFRKDAGAGGFPDASRSAEEIGVSEFATRYGVLQRGGQRTLPHHRVKGGRTILSR